MSPAQVLEYTPAEAALSLMGHDHWSVPAAILDAVFRPRSKNAVKSCHASSKTFAAADATILALFEGADVLTTANTWTQTQQVLWRQIRDAVRDCKIPLAEIGRVNQTSIELPSGEFALGLNTEDRNQGVNFQGYHARPGSYLLIIVDEAAGVSPEILSAIGGIAAGGDVRLLYLGNPTVASGPFFEIFRADVPGWRRWTIDAFDTPNLRGLTVEDLLAMPEHELDANPREYLITRRYVRDKYREVGPDHWEWQARVRGQFPEQTDESLISLAWLEQSALRPAAYDPSRGPIVAGIDVAGPGEDETVLAVRQGPSLLSMRAYAAADARGPVVAALRPWTHHGLTAVNVDEIGQGWYFAEHLRDALDGVTVRGINVGERATSDEAAERYANLKAELYWNLRERFRDADVAGLTDRVSIAQLAGIRYEHDARGRIVIESKDKARRRGVKSPDRAEALMLAFAPADPAVDVASLYGKSFGERVG